MSLYEISIAKDHHWEIMNELGKLDCMHFVDLNEHEQPFNLYFAPWVKRWDDTLRRITNMKEEWNRLGVELKKPKHVNSFIEYVESLYRSRKKSPSLLLEEIENELKVKDKFVNEQMDHLKKIHDDFNHLIQYKNVLSKAASILGGRVENDQSISLDMSKESISVHESLVNAKEITIGHIAGTVLREEQERFNKLIFRATRGNAIVCFKEFTKPICDYVGKKYFKSAYVIIFQEGDFIRDKIIRICDSFSGERYEIPYGGFTNKLKELEIKIRDTRKILTNTRDELRKFLSAANTIENEDSSALIIYEWYVIKEKAIFYNSWQVKKRRQTFLRTLLDSKQQDCKGHWRNRET